MCQLDAVTGVFLHSTVTSFPVLTTGSSPRQESFMAEPFGKYLLHEKIAQGGMAEVFLATREGSIGGFKRRLAIKRMFSHLVEREEIINMFIDEARIAARLNHPNIVQIYDLGIVEKSFFIAMEYVEGLDLRRICEMGVNQKNFIPRPLAVYIASQVAMGLDYAHTRKDEQDQPMNIVHRDVSPQNVLVSSVGAVKVCDFGIAKAENRLTDTQIGEFKGKFSYMSPEQFGHHDLDHRSDIFTLGILLYETTVGTRLFRASSEYETMRKVTDGDFHPPRRIRPDYSPRLEEIVLKALATEPDDRYQSAGELQEDLEDWLFEERVRTGPRQLAAYLAELSEEEDGGRQQPARISRPSPGPLVVVEEEGEEDATQQVALTPEQMRKLGREHELESFEDSLDAEEDDPTIQMEVSPAEMEELRKIAEQGVKQDETVQDMDPPVAVAQLRTGGVEAVDVRREEGEVKRQSGPVQIERMQPGRDSTLVEDELEEETTSPLETPSGYVDYEISEEDEELEKEEDITGRWSGERRRERENREEAGLSERPAHQRAAGGVGPGGVASSSPVANGRMELEEVPELKPGGRSLSGLNVVQRQSEDARQTAPVPAVTDAGSGLSFLEANRSLIIIVAAAMGTLVLGLGVVILLSSSEEEVEKAAESSGVEEDEDELAPPWEDYQAVGGEEISLIIESDPQEAAVVVNGLLQEETTPTQVNLVDGRDNEVWVVRRRYRPKRLLIPAEGTDLERSVELERAAATDDVEVTFASDPEGAEVWINGESAPFAAPVTMNVGADFATHVQFVKEGYQPYVAFVDFSEDRDRLEVTLSATEESTVVGDYALRPDDSRVYVGGRKAGKTPFLQRHHGDEWLELEVEAEGHRPSHHRLRTDKIGGFTLAMELEREARSTGRISIDVEPTSAVYIDARAFGTSPVEEAELPAGEQTVVLETSDGRRLRVPLDVEVDAHVEYRLELDGDEVDVERVD